MHYPNVNYLQSFDSNLANSGTNQIVSGIADFPGAVWNAGFVNPQVATISSTSLTVTVTTSPTAEFGCLFGTGLFSKMHGTQTGADTQTATVSFSALVPGSGTTVAYLIGSYAQIQQNPIVITGPPPGHPAFNPTFQATQGYTTNVDSINFGATTTPPDNVTNIEFLRVTLTAGSSSIASLNTAFRPLASMGDLNTFNSIALTGNYNLSVGAANTTFIFSGSGSYIYLPAPSASNGYGYNVVNSGAHGLYLQPVDGSTIYGTYGTSGVAAAYFPPYSAARLLSLGNCYMMSSSSPTFTNDTIMSYWYTVPGTSAFVVPAGVTKLLVRVVGGGGGGAGAGSNFTAAGGGGGGYAEGVLSVVPGASYNVTVGGGGAGGVISGGTGGGGGTSSFDNLFVASGGGGGAVNDIAGSGGTAANAYAGIAINGDTGGFPIVYLGVASTCGVICGPGGNAYLTPTTHQTVYPLTGGPAYGPNANFWGQGGGGAGYDAAGGAGYNGYVWVIGW